MDSGWDVKHMVRTIVTSQDLPARPHRRDARALAARPAQPRTGPAGRLPRRRRARSATTRWRSPACSWGKVGGPSVKPYQPLWVLGEPELPPSASTSRTQGEAQYRRGLYTRWQRSFLHPSLRRSTPPAARNAPPSGTVITSRSRCLVLFNDPSYVEAARVFASRVIREGGPAGHGSPGLAGCALAKPGEAETPSCSSCSDKHPPIIAGSRRRPEADGLGWVRPATRGSTRPRSRLDPWPACLLNLHETVTRA